MSIIAIMQRSHHSFSKGWCPFVSGHIESLYLVLPASPAERRRLASCDSGVAEAISIGRYNEWANRRESIGFCNQRPESPVWPALYTLTL